MANEDINVRIDQTLNNINTVLDTLSGRMTLIDNLQGRVAVVEGAIAQLSNPSAGDSAEDPNSLSGDTPSNSPGASLTPSSTPTPGT